MGATFILVTPILVYEVFMEQILYKALEAVQKGQSYAFVTIVEATLKGTPRKEGAKMIVFDDGTSWGISLARSG